MPCQLPGDPLGRKPRDAASQVGSGKSFGFWKNVLVAGPAAEGFELVAAEFDFGEFRAAFFAEKQVQRRREEASDDDDLKQEEKTARAIKKLSGIGAGGRKGPT